MPADSGRYEIEVDDELPRKIIRLLKTLNSGETMTRKELIWLIFKIEPPDNLIMCSEDRLLRSAIVLLQADGWAVISPHGQAGYKLAEGDELHEYILDLRARIGALSKKIHALENGPSNEDQMVLL